MSRNIDNESVTVDGISPEEMAAIKEYLGFDLDTRDTTHGSSSADDAVAASAVQPMAMASSTRHQELLRQQMGQMQSQQHPPAQHSPPMYPQSRPTATRHSPVAYTTKLPLPSVHARAETTTGSASTARSSATSGDDGLVVPADWNSNSARGSPLPAAGPRCVGKYYRYRDIYTHTYTHIRLHVSIHIHANIRMQSPPHIHMPMSMSMYTHACAHHGCVRNVSSTVDVRYVESVASDAMPQSRQPSWSVCGGLYMVEYTRMQCTLCDIPWLTLGRVGGLVDP